MRSCDAPSADCATTSKPGACKAAHLQQLHHSMGNFSSEDRHDFLKVQVAFYEAQHHQNSSNHMVVLAADPQVRLCFGCLSAPHVTCTAGLAFGMECSPIVHALQCFSHVHAIILGNLEQDKIK